MDSPPNRRNALGNADRLVSPGSTAICVTRRIYRLYIRCRSKRSQASFHCGLCNNCSMLLSHSCSGKGPQTHRTVKSLFLVYSSEPLIFIFCTFSLVAHTRRRETVLGVLAMLGSFIGGLGLLLLSILDTKRHSSAHRAFLLVFIIGVALSAIFTILEVSVRYRGNRLHLISISTVG